MQSFLKTFVVVVCLTASCVTLAQIQSGPALIDTVPMISNAHGALIDQIDKSGVNSETLKERYLTWVSEFSSQSENLLEATLELQKKLEYIQINLGQLSKSTDFLVPKGVGVLVAKGQPEPSTNSTNQPSNSAVTISTSLTALTKTVAIGVSTTSVALANPVASPLKNSERLLGGYPALIALVLIFLIVFVLYFKFFEKLFMSAKDRRAAGIDRFFKKIVGSFVAGGIAVFLLLLVI